VRKSELIDALAERLEGNRKQAAQALEAVLDTITREVARGREGRDHGLRHIREARPQGTLGSQPANR